jgi:biotin transport system substrate-specific component
VTTASAARQPSGATVLVTRPLALGCGVIGFALLTWAGAKASVPLPFTPVPGTLQMLPVLLAGALLGARGGAASQIAYLLMGMAGLPVFALPGAGPAYLLGPTAGYLLGFVAAAYVTGRAIGGRRPAGAARAFLAFVAGSAALHLCGLAWLTALAGGHLGAAVRAGLQPFLLFDLAKIVLATGVYTAWGRWRCTRARTRDDATPR